MGLSVFPTIDEAECSYVAGLWKGYGDAISDVFDAPSNLMESMRTTWLGPRAQRFDQWWDQARMDAATLAGVAHSVADALTAFTAEVPAINRLSASASAIILQHMTPGASGWYSLKGSIDDPDYFTIQCSCFDIYVHGGQSGGESPAWLHETRSLLMRLVDHYQEAAKRAASKLSTANDSLKHMSMLKEVPRDSPAFNSSDPVLSLSDPTWVLLTGGGVFRPTMAPGFLGNPFSSAQRPDWYKPDEVMKITKAVVAHIPFLLNLAAVAFVPSGQEEVSAGLMVLSATIIGAEGVNAAIQGNWVEAGADGLSMVFDLAGAGAAGSTAKEIAEIQLGDSLKTAVADVLEKGEDAVGARAAGAIGEYTQDKAQEYVKEFLQERLDEGEKGEVRVDIPPTLLHEWVAEAYALKAAGLNPATALP